MLNKGANSGYYTFRNLSIEKYKKEHEKEIEHVKSIEEQLKESMEAQYDKDLIDYDALFKSLTKWA